MRRIVKRLSYANVMSTLALFLAIGGGTALAATRFAANSVGPKAIRANAVGPVKIKAGAVTSEKIASSAVTANQIANGAVGTTKLSNGAVTGTQLANGAVGANQIANGSVGTTKLATGAVGPNELANGSVGTTKLANGAVGPNELAAGAVGGSKLGTINTRTEPVSVAAGKAGEATASCAAGETLLAGGTSWDTTKEADQLLLTTIESSKSSPTTWHAVGVNKTSGALNFSVSAYCLAG